MQLQESAATFQDTIGSVRCLFFFFFKGVCLVDSESVALFNHEGV